MSPPSSHVLGRGRTFHLLCNKMPLSLSSHHAPGRISCPLQAPRLGFAVFLKQMTLFHPRMWLTRPNCPIFTRDISELWETLPSSPKSGFIGVYNKSREGRDKLGTLCLLSCLHMCHGLQLVASQQAQELNSCPCLELRICVFRFMGEGWMHPLQGL